MTENTFTFSGLLTVKDVCAVIKMSRFWIYEQVEKGEFPAPLKFGRSIRWKAEDVRQYLDKKELERQVH